MIIEHYPNYTCSTCPALMNRRDKIDLNLSIKEKLKPNQTLTNALALKFLNEVREKSADKAFFHRPLIFRSVNFLVTSISVYFAWITPAFATASFAIPVILAILSACQFVTGCLNGKTLQEISEAWKAQSQKATEYINILENSQNSVLRLQ